MERHILKRIEVVLRRLNRLFLLLLLTLRLAEYRLCGVERARLFDLVECGVIFEGRQLACIVLHQRRLDAVINRVKHGTLVDKTHLDFCGMDVDVNQLVGHRQIEHTGRKFSDHDGALAGLLERCHRRPRLDVSSVDEEILEVAVRSGVDGLGYVAANGNHSQLIVNGNQALRKFAPHDGIDGGQQLSVARCFENLLAVADIGKRDLRVRQRGFVYNIGNIDSLGHVLFEELRPCGNIEKEVADDERRTHRAACVQHCPFFTALDGVGGADFLIFIAGEQLQTGNRADGSKRFSAEAERRDAVEILLLTHLAGGVAKKRNLDILSLNAAAVVGDTHESRSAVLDLNGNML